MNLYKNKTICNFVIIIFLFIFFLTACSNKTNQQKKIPTDINQGNVKSQPVSNNKNVINVPFRKELLNTSKIILKVKGMTCGADIEKLQAAVKNVRGCKHVFVDLINGKAEIFYLDKKLKKTGALVSKIEKKAGFQSSVLKIMNNEELKNEYDLKEKMKKDYILSINDEKLKREYFEKELNVYKSGYIKNYGENIFNDENGKNVWENIQYEIINKFTDQVLIMQKIRQSGFNIDESVYQDELKKFLDQNSITLKQAVSRSGYSEDDFLIKMREQVLINKYLDTEIFKEARSDSQKSFLFKNWYNNLRTDAMIFYYDDDLHEMMQRQAINSTGCC